MTGVRACFISSVISAPTQSGGASAMSTRGRGRRGPPPGARVPPRHVYSGSALSLPKQVAALRAVSGRGEKEKERHKSAVTLNNMQTEGEEEEEEDGAKPSHRDYFHPLCFVSTTLHTLGVLWGGGRVLFFFIYKVLPVCKE